VFLTSHEPGYEEDKGRDTKPGKAMEQSIASMSSSLLLKVLTYDSCMLGHWWVEQEQEKGRASVREIAGARVREE